MSKESVSRLLVQHKKIMFTLTNYEIQVFFFIYGVLQYKSRLDIVNHARFI